MRAHVLQHVPFETAAAIGTWLRAADAAITTTRLFEPHALPNPDDVDYLVVMGGPMSANDEQALPWLVDEKRLIRRTIDAGTPVIGVCLGAQLMASAMGARVYPNREKEIGWLPVTPVPPPTAAGALFREALPVFQWHGETFDLPDDAEHLARSEGCEHQAFRIGSHAVGLQFHLEVEPDGVANLVEHCGAELAPSTYVQSAARILGEPPATYGQMHDVLAGVLSSLTGLTNPGGQLR